MEKAISQDGTSIAYDRRGSGPALILVGGAIQHRAMDPDTAHLAELLAAQFTTYHYDRRGRGDSGNTLPYAVAREIEDIAALIAAAGGTAFLFGMSSGALLALDATNQRGSRIPKLALYEPPFIVDDSRPSLPADYVQQLDRMEAEGRRGDMVALFMTAAVGMPAEYVGPMRDQAMWPALEAVAPTIAYDGRIMGGTMSGQPLPAGRWANVTVPTLVIDGGASPVHMHNGADALAALLPQARRLTLPDQTHSVDMEILAPPLAQFFSAPE